MIDQYSYTNYFTYITKEAFQAHHSQEEWEDFSIWMRGQKCPIIDGRIAFYSWDYEKWAQQKED